VTRDAPRAGVPTPSAPPAGAGELDAGQARRICLRAQGLAGPRWAGGPAGVLERQRAVQLDTIAVLARSHELVSYARLGPVGRPAVERALWADPPTAFEYWAHAACVLPLADWPYFAFRRREFAARGQRWHTDPGRGTAQVLARLQADGPLTATELGGAKAGGPWWDWSQVKVAVEWLLDLGTVVCTRRAGFRRVYDLAARAVPAELAAVDADDDACLAALTQRAGRALGVATAADLADYYRLRVAQVVAALPRTGLVPVRVAGWGAPAWADPAALDDVDRRPRHSVTLLSPFDPMVWHRPRTERLFGFRHRLEAYTPAERREHGYYVMPVLAGGRLVGRADPKRERTWLRSGRVSVTSPAWGQAAGRALGAAAGWVDRDTVALGPVTPPSARAEVARGLRAAGVAVVDGEPAS